MIELIREKLKNNRDSFQLYLGNSLISLFNFITIALLSHFLVPDEYGSFRYILMVTSIAISIGSLGFSQSIFYHLTKSKTAQEAYNYINSLRIGLIISSVAVSVFLYIYYLLFGTHSFFDWNKYNVWIILLVVPAIFQSTELNIFLSMKRVGAYFTNTLSLLSIKLALVFIAYTVKASLIHYILILSITGFLPTLINTIYIERFFNEEKFEFHLELLKKIWRYGLPVGIGLFFGIIMTHTDKLLLSYLFNDAISIAKISNGNFEVPLITVFYTSFSAIAFPLMIKVYQEGDIQSLIKIRQKYQKEVVLILYPIVIALIAWSPSFIKIAFGDFYETSAIFFAIYAITFFTRFTSYHDVFLITHNTKYIPLIQGIELVFHIFLTYVLIKMYGLIGASFAALITNLIYAFVCIFLSKKILKVSMLDIVPFWYLYKIILIASIIMFPFYFISSFFGSDFIKLICSGIYVVICILTLYKIETKRVIS